MDFNGRDINLKLFFENFNKINSGLELEFLLKEIIIAAKHILNCDRGSLLLKDEENNELFFNTISEEKEIVLKTIKVPLGIGIASLVFQSGKPEVVNDPNDPRVFRVVDELTNKRTNNLLAVALKVKDNVIGVIEVLNTVDKRDFDANDIELLTFIANQAAIAINDRTQINLLNRIIKEITILYEISLVLNLSYEFEGFCKKAVEIIMHKMEVERISLFVISSKTNNLKLVAHTGINAPIEDGLEIEIDSGIIGYVFRNGKPLLVSDIENDPILKPLKRNNYKSKSFLSVPIELNNKIIGVLSVADKKSSEQFNNIDLIIIQSVTSSVANAFQSIETKRRLIEQEKLDKEMESAVSLQKSIMPTNFSEIKDLDVYAKLYPSNFVSGDFYDYTVYNEKEIGFMIGDVSGKGLPASIFMALARKALKIHSEDSIQPSIIFEKSNRNIFSDSKNGMFATAFFLLLDKQKQTFTYTSAGHNPQIFIRRKKGEMILLYSLGKPLGILANATYKEETFKYEKGDVIVLYTDGIIEAENAKRELFGEERLYSLVMEKINLNAKEIANTIMDDLNTFTHHNLDDDLTLLIIKL
ncbi:MAG: SpoIIE family protein phosphatase [Leptospiraceae bacterium]|nr:SpoIIE family protein phosphatase [Leptospiraceae bacterium]MCP5495644.1 SpoIIE family protein phosphatase [Leptospiraceae bacterium]